MRSLRSLAFVVVGMLVVQFCLAWNRPSSCGDGSDSSPHSTSPALPSSTEPASSSTIDTSFTSSSSSASSSFDSGEERSDACDCSPPPTMVSATSVAASSPAESSSSFTFDGATSDIAQQLYDRYVAGDEADQLTLQTVPDAVQSRLHNLSMNFEDLPGQLQRAVHWDSGFAVTSDSRAVQVWTLDNRTMTDLAISVEEFNAAGCEALMCTDSNGDTAQIYENCRQSPVDVLSASKCVVEAFESGCSSNGAVWSIGGNSTMIPGVRVVRNAGIASCRCTYTMYSIHTASPLEQSLAESGCPADPWSGSLVIPCYGNDTVPDALRDRVTTPKGSDWVTKWVLEHGEREPTTESSKAPSQGSASATTEAGEGGGGGLSWWWLLIILLIILLLIVATVVACRHCHRLSRFTSPPDNNTYIFVGGRMWAVQDESHCQGTTYWLRFASWCRKMFSLLN